MVIYLDVILLFLPNTSPSASQISQYLEIFGFIGIYFMFFSNKEFVGIHSVLNKSKSVFYGDDNLLKKYDILRTVEQKGRWNHF